MEGHLNRRVILCHFHGSRSAICLWIVWVLWACRLCRAWNLRRKRRCSVKSADRKNSNHEDSHFAEYVICVANLHLARNDKSKIQDASIWVMPWMVHPWSQGQTLNRGIHPKSRVSAVESWGNLKDFTCRDGRWSKPWKMELGPRVGALGAPWVMALQNLRWLMIMGNDFAILYDIVWLYSLNISYYWGISESTQSNGNPVIKSSHQIKGTLFLDEAFDVVMVNRADDYTT